MFARFDENPGMTLRVIKETKRYGRTDVRTDNVKTVYPLQTKFAGGIKRVNYSHIWVLMKGGKLVIHSGKKQKKTIVGILTFISMTNTPFESLKAKKALFFSILFLWAVEISSCLVDLSMNKVL